MVIKTFFQVTNITHAYVNKTKQFLATIYTCPRATSGTAVFVAMGTCVLLVQVKM